MNTRALLRNPLAWMFGGALVVSWLFGSWHAFAAHGAAQAGIALLVPPYGVYMAVEQEYGHARDGTGVRVAGDREADIAVLVARCNANAEAQEKSGLSKRAYDVWCACTMRMALDNLPDGENEYVAKHGRNSPQFAPIIKHARATCYESAKFLGGSTRLD